MYSSKEYLTLKELRTFEQQARRNGLSEQILIENASSNLANTIDGLRLGCKALVIAGRGNNGADALCCARKLRAKNYDVSVALITPKPLGPMACAQKDILKKLKVPLYHISHNSLAMLERLLKGADFVLDGILGIGLNGALDELLREVILRINKSKKKVVACDVPSGLSADDGAIEDVAVRADYTITFIGRKKGFRTEQGKQMCGKIITVDIGI